LKFVQSTDRFPLCKKPAGCDKGFKAQTQTFAPKKAEKRADGGLRGGKKGEVTRVSPWINQSSREKVVEAWCGRKCPIVGKTTMSLGEGR